MKHWFLLVDYTFQTLIGRSFSVWTSGGEDIEDLKEKVKEKRRIDLADVDAARLTVWKTKGSMVIDDSKAEILKNINLDDEDTIERLNERMQVADLGLDGQVLLVQLPDPKRVHQVITNNDEGVDAVPELKEFQRMFLPLYLSLAETVVRL
ncbi:hypothetical protein EDB86DRAFT_3022103 [Lactarius hatsudake]|nr:hypothetical protein EDB86DRAFT_3022103 [Lactarius hatsudake]